MLFVGQKESESSVPLPLFGIGMLEAGPCERNRRAEQ